MSMQAGCQPRGKLAANVDVGWLQIGKSHMPTTWAYEITQTYMRIGKSYMSFTNFIQLRRIFSASLP